jgi:heme-degrading monooxygenase HmoA
MSVVKINVLTVPPEMRETLERRFAGRAGMVEQADGFEWFELLRPVEGTDDYLVYTRWRSEKDFEAWQSSMAFSAGHAGATGSGPAPHGGAPHGSPSSTPVSHGSGAPGGTAPGAASGAAAGHGGAAQGGAAQGGAAQGGAPHAGAAPGGHVSGAPGGPAPHRPAATGSTLWSFEVVQSASPAEPNSTPS